jgi:hypothetical protein
MTAKRLLELNGDFHSSPLFEAVRRFHTLSISQGLPYCVIGGLAVVRNGAPRTTMDIDILTTKDDWKRALPLKGEIISTGPESCLDKPSGVTIDILFAEDDWQMPLALPDPRKVAEFDAELGANFIGLHALVQLKMSIHLSKLQKDGPGAAAKDLSDVHELISKNRASFTRQVLQGYDPAIRKQCIEIFEEVLRSSKRKNKGRGGMDL